MPIDGGKCAGVKWLLLISGAQGVLCRGARAECQAEDICSQLQSSLWWPQHCPGTAQVQV